MDLKVKDIPDMILVCFVLHNFCEKPNTEPISADMDRVIIMELVNVPTKGIHIQHERRYNTKDIEHEGYTHTTQKMAEPLEMQSHDILRRICKIMEKQT